MSEKRFVVDDDGIYDTQEEKHFKFIAYDWMECDIYECCDLLNEQQELIEELQTSDEMGWKRAEKFEKKCPKELHNKKMYIKRLEYKVQKFKEENEQLRKQMQNYEKLIANSYVGEEERLDGFVGKYVIWEDELQKYKDKNEMIEDEQFYKKTITVNLHKGT